MSDWNKGSEKEAFEAGHLKPLDSHNAELLNKTHPYKYVNPEPKELYNLVVIGAGAGGLVTAAQAAKRGAKVALIEKELMGGDCLNIGCVPSKALLACAKRAAAARHSASSKYGVNIKGGDSSTTVDFSYVMKRMRELRAGIATNDSVQRFTKLGVDVFIGTGEFSAEEKKTVLVNGKIKLRYVKACIATGGRAYVPNIEGIDKVPYVTNKTLFNVTEVPRRLAIIGGGPIGCEMAQAFARFGSKVVVFEKHPQPLRREDPDAAKVLIEAMERDGIVFRPNTAFRRVEKKDDEITIFHSDTKTKKEDETKCDLLLIATGRAPNVDGIGLNHVNVKFDRRSGVQVDDFLRTSNPDIYAVGDVCLAEKFTHMAGETGVMVCKNAVFGGQEKYSDRVIPWVTYTQPEIAHVGKYESELKPGTFRTYTLGFAHNDRCIAEGTREGFVRIHTGFDEDRILGATIVGDEAGEMIGLYTLAMHAGIGAKKVAEIIAPYPTRSEMLKYTCNQFNIMTWGGWDGLKKSHTPIAEAHLRSDA